jgi:hypothetical protein
VTELGINGTSKTTAPKAKAVDGSMLRYFDRMDKNAVLKNFMAWVPT